MKLQITRRWALSLMGSSVVMGLAILSGCGGGSGGPLNRPSPTPTPTATPTGPQTATVFSTSGTFSRATGTYTQTRGSFERLRGTLLPAPVPGPDDPDPTPDPNSNVVIYTGTYSLSSGETGEFIFTSLPGDIGDGVGASPEFFRLPENSEMVGSGTATVSLQISGSTGSGTIRLSNNDSGTIAITSSARASAQNQAAMRRFSQIKARRARLLKR